MQVKTGIDMVHIPTFRETVSAGGDVFIARIVQASELRKNTIEHLAGIYAAKEAVIKALGLPPGSWHTIEVGHQETGKPVVEVIDDASLSCDISITHHHEYACASAVFIYE